MAVISRACSRGLVLFLVISAAIAGKSLGPAAMSCLAKVIILALAPGAWLSMCSIFGEKI